MNTNTFWELMTAPPPKELLIFCILLWFVVLIVRYKKHKEKIEDEKK